MDEHIADRKAYIEECKIVRNAIERAKKAEYYHEVFKILEDVISKYPSNYYTSQAKNLLNQYKYEQAHPAKKIKVDCTVVGAENYVGKFTFYVNGAVAGTFVGDTNEHIPQNNGVVATFLTLREGDRVKFHAEIVAARKGKKFVASKEVTVNSSSFKEALIFLFASWF